MRNFFVTMLGAASLVSTAAHGVVVLSVGPDAAEALVAGSAFAEPAATSDSTADGRRETAVPAPARPSQESAATFKSAGDGARWWRLSRLFDR